MTVKLALLDVDGTLKDEAEWAPGALELIERLGAAGVAVSLSSGRTPFSLRDLVDDRPEVTFLAGSGGGVIQGRTDDGWRSIAGHRVPPFVVQEVINETRDAEVELWVFTADAWYVAEETETVRWDAEITGSQFTVTDLSTIDDDVVKMAIIPADDEERAYAYEMSSRHEAIAVVQSHPRIIDLVPDNAMRFKGGDAIVGHLGIMWRDVLCVGDGENDLGMLGAAGHSFLMAPLTVDRLTEQQREKGERFEVDSLQPVLDRLDQLLTED